VFAPLARRLLVILLVLPPHHPATRAVVDGARLGVEEAARASALFGQPAPELVIDTMTLPTSNGTMHDAPVRANASDAAASETVVAIIGGVDSESCLAASRAAAARGALLLALDCADAPSGASTAGPAMNTLARTFHLGTSGAGERWLPTLEAFGAAQLNARFAAHAGQPMTSAAWAGWMAVKAVSEAALRTKSAQPDALAAYLAAPTTRLDGHKGVPLSFSPREHRLVQPVYRVSP
jgi:hypothetical protein